MSFTNELPRVGSVPRKRAAKAPMLRMAESRVEKAVFSPNQNHLLAALPQAEYERLLPQLELRVLPLGRVLYDSNVESKFLYFPIDSIISTLKWTGRTTTEEVAVAGNKGLVGLPLLVKSELEFGWSMVQVAGHAYVVQCDIVKAAFMQDGPFHTLLQDYGHAVANEMARTAFCNRHHTTLQKVCRWLLLRFDRMNASELTGTSALIATLLGEKVTAVSESMSSLQEIGGIDYTANRIFIRSRMRLESFVCGCYADVTKVTDACFTKAAG